MFSCRDRVFNIDADTSQSPLGAKDKDLINRLPEDILVRILSFLSTEEAIKTSILSKRWKYLWLSIPNFTFYDSSTNWSRTKCHDQVLELRANFLDSIGRALLLRNASYLGSFSLWSDVPVAASWLHSCVSAAVKRNVQELNLILFDKGEYVLPNSLFSSKSLSRLWLHIWCTLKAPSFICFSGLKKLHLHGVVFQDDQSAQQLFSGCPVLEDLILISCNWENIKEITIEIPTLRSLKFSDINFLPDPFLSCKIIISGLNLETLDVYSSLSIELLLCNLISLNSAKVYIDRWNGRQGHSHCILKLLSELHNVKSLHLSSETLEPLLFAENVEEHLPTFSKLINLFGFVERPLFGDDEPYASGALVYVLQKSPNLETLDLGRGFKPQELYMMLEMVPNCFRRCLKKFVIFNFDNNGEDLCLLKHIYENAPLLNQLVIKCLPDFSKD